MLAIVAGFMGNNDETAIVELETCMEQIPREFLPADAVIGDRIDIAIDMDGIRILKAISKNL